jgi:thioredoxin 1
MMWALVIVVLGWYLYEGQWDRQLFKSEPGRVCVNLHPEEAKAFLDANSDAQVLDVRSAREHRNGALPGAVLISFSDANFEQRVRALDKTKPVLVYCAGGFRSRKSVAILKEQGFMNIQHLHRGYHSWQLAGLPVEKAMR